MPRGGQPSADSKKLDEVIPPPARRTGSRVSRWAVGVTTAPRQSPTLERCLTSLATTGWDKPRLFVDGDAPVPPEFASLARTDRRPQLGAWPSYYLALAELLMREPEADAYMIVQDDALFAADFDVRAYLEQVLWPGKTPWTVSLFCARPYTQSQPGWHPLRGAWVWGRWRSCSRAKQPSASLPTSTWSSIAGAAAGARSPTSTGESASGRPCGGSRSITRRRALCSISARSARCGRAHAPTTTAVPRGSPGDNRRQATHE